MASKSPSEQPPVQVNYEATSLLRKVIDSSANYAKVVGAHLDVNRTDMDAMEHLIEHGAMTAGELAKAIGVTPGTATSVIDRLVSVGHASRMPNPDDRRGILVVPNPMSVEAAWHHILPLIRDSERTLSAMNEVERQAVTTYLEQMLKSYEQLGHRKASS